MSLYADYITERYNEHDYAPYSVAKLSAEFEQINKAAGNSIYKTDKSFVVYRFQGDAVIVVDIFVSKEHRRSHEARKLFESVVAVGQQNGKRVAIGFKEYIGKNHHLGLTAVAAVGFVPAFQTKTCQVFIKGI